MIRRGRLEDGVRVEILHRDLDHTQDEHVRGGEPAESVHNKPDEFQGARDDATRALREPLQVTLGVGPEVKEAHEHTAHKEEGVDAEGSVRDGLKEESLLRNFAKLHVVRVLEENDARVSEDNPGHRYRPEPVHGADGVSAHVTVADDLQVGANGKRKQKFLEDTCKSNRKRQGKDNIFHDSGDMDKTEKFNVLSCRPSVVDVGCKSLSRSLLLLIGCTPLLLESATGTGRNNRDVCGQG